MYPFRITTDLAPQNEANLNRREGWGRAGRGGGAQAPLLLNPPGRDLRAHSEPQAPWQQAHSDTDTNLATTDARRTDEENGENQRTDSQEEKKIIGILCPEPWADSKDAGGRGSKPPGRAGRQSPEAIG